MTPAYFTGKVWIGSNYHPDTRPHIEGDMFTLQTALINKEFGMNNPEDWNRYYMNRPTDTTNMVPTPSEKWLDRFDTTVTWIVRTITACIAAGFFIAAYEIYTKHLS